MDNQFTQLIVSYPKSQIHLPLRVYPYSITTEDTKVASFASNAETMNISPYGLLFHTGTNYDSGTILKIQLKLDYYWEIKQRFVDYSRVTTPKKFHLLAKVMDCQKVAKRGWNKKITAKIVYIDETDSMVLYTLIEEAK